MRKIFILIGSLDLGGTEKQLFLKLLSLKKKFNFTLLVFSKKGYLYQDFKKKGISIHDISVKYKFAPLKIFTVLYKLIILLKKETPSIVNLYLPHSYLIGGWLSFLFPNIKFLMTRRSLNYYQKKIPFVKIIETKILHKRMKYILVNSKAIYNQMLNEEGVKEKKLKLIYNSVKIDGYNKKFTKSKIVKIILLANLIPYKNHKLVIKACNIIKDLDFQVSFVGEGSASYTKELEDLILMYNIRDKFNFCGRIKNVGKIINESDIGILSSDEEGFSNSILEYMARKLPVLATNVGGNSEIIEHNNNGYIVEKGDHENFAKYLKMLIVNINLRKKFGLAGYRIVREKFAISKNIINYYNFYKKVLENR